MQAVQIHNGFFLVFERGEEVMSAVAAFCEREKVNWAIFDGIGAVENVEIGYYDLENQAYVFREEPGPFEVVAFKGNVAEMDELPVVHAHASLARSDETLEAIGGHIRSATVAVTLEMSFWFVSQPLMRSFNEDIGLNLIDLL